MGCDLRDIVKRISQGPDLVRMAVLDKPAKAQ